MNIHENINEVFQYQRDLSLGKYIFEYLSPQNTEDKQFKVLFLLYLFDSASGWLGVCPANSHMFKVVIDTLEKDMGHV